MAKPTGMFRKVAILIVAICLGIVAFDYAQHARTPDGELVDISQYVGGVSDRFMAQKQAMEMTSRRSELLAMRERDHLPAAPQGWKRRDWSDGDRALLFPPSDPLLSLPEDLRDRPQIKALKTLEETARLAGQKSEVYVYENRDNVIAIRLQIRREDTEGIQGMAKAVIESNLESLSEKEGFAVVRGVTYRHEIPAGESADSPSGYRVFSARLGDTITIGVRARASDEALYALLDSIDYDSLNMLLPQPLPRIGSAAPEIAFEDQKEIADARVKAEVAEQAAQARAASLRLQYWADKVNRLTVRTCRTGLASSIRPPPSPRSRPLQLPPPPLRPRPLPWPAQLASIRRMWSCPALVHRSDPAELPSRSRPHCSPLSGMS